MLDSHEHKHSDVTFTVANCKNLGNCIEPILPGSMKSRNGKLLAKCTELLIPSSLIHPTLICLSSPSIAPDYLSALWIMNEYLSSHLSSRDNSFLPLTHGPFTSTHFLSFTLKGGIRRNTRCLN
eukprot:TRINITY_DN16488_c0_g1::TRINITY_DN16488_c0_g1_i1::g.1861::m.1861 TRINITY_DN16488_c0_g1::TRINITY_DN16488_c0_g1_i1::g.1861  ORF type:complete len:124 (+),score=6.83,DUF1514/PF07438.6/0.021 TRINITY_DN16488_c0_g1_i1:162-533(+)